VSWPAALRTADRRATALFAAVELVLALSIPFLAIAGYHSLLDSHAGRFVQEPTDRDPGWRAEVDPTPVTAVVEETEGRITGIALVASRPGATSGANVILVPGTLVVDGQPLDQRPAEGAVSALAATLRLRLGPIEVVNGVRWALVLGAGSYRLENPDPVVGPGGEVVLPVGPVEVDAANAGSFLGRPAPGAEPVTLVYRRHLFWEALLAEPPTGDDPLAAWLASVSGSGAQVVDLPWLVGGHGPQPDGSKTEAMIRELVAVPAGAQPGDRTQVRVLDRTGTADLSSIAAEVAAAGFEVVEIGNAARFDGGLTSLVVPGRVNDQGLIQLAARTGAATVVDGDGDADPVATLLVGSDFALPTSRGVPAEQRSGTAGVGPPGGAGR
jgi:hypothetical protein